MAASSADCESPYCTAPAPAGQKRCIAHVSNAELRDAVKEGHVDARGARIDAQRFSELLWCLPTDKESRPLFESAQFEGATFAAMPEFDQAVFAGSAHFDEAVFDGGLDLASCEFADSAHFTAAVIHGEGRFGGAKFKKEAYFADARFSEADFIGATFDQAPNFRRARFTDNAFFSRAVFQQGGRFDDASFHGATEFRGTIFHGATVFTEVQFARQSSFVEAVFEAPPLFGNAQFAGRAWFTGAQLQHGGSLSSVRFAGDVALDLTANGHVDLNGARFETTTGLGHIQASGTLNLDDAAFAERVSLEYTGPRLSARRSEFRGGATLEVGHTDVTLTDASFGAPSLLTKRTDAPPAAHARLLSLRGADVSGLALSRINLGDCLFAGAHNLDELRLDADTPLASPPQRRWQMASLNDRSFWTARSTIIEENEWRLAQGWRGWRARGPAENLSDAPVQDLDALQIAGLYRSLRKSREDVKDAPGAADFYYGEMEMRRHARRDTRSDAPSRGETAIIWPYWALSGYGLRASRALIALLMVSLVVAAASSQWAFEDGIGFVASLRFVFDAALLLTTKAYADLTGFGEWMRLVMRITGPLLIGLALLAVRGRIKR